MKLQSLLTMRVKFYNKSITPLFAALERNSTHLNMSTKLYNMSRAKILIRLWNKLVYFHQKIANSMQLVSFSSWST